MSDTDQRKLKEELSNVVFRYLDIYFGTKEELSYFWRAVWTIIGSFTMLSFKFAWNIDDPWSAVQATMEGRVPVANGILFFIT